MIIPSTTLPYVVQAQAQKEEPKSESEEYQQSLEEAVQQAQEEAERQIQEEKEKAWQRFLEEIAAKEEEERLKAYQEQQRALEEEIALAKRKRAAEGLHLSPREIALAKQKAMEQFQQQLEEAIQEWREQNIEAAKQQLAGWEAEVRASAKEQIEKAKAESLKEFEQYAAAPKQAPSLAEQILSWKPLIAMPSLGVVPVEYEAAPNLGKFMLAGLVATGESIVYGISDLIGVGVQKLGEITGAYKFEYSPYWHPAYAPTVTGAVITSGIESAMAFQLKPSEEMKELGAFKEKYGTPEAVAYGVGSIIGDIMAAYVFGKAAGYSKRQISNLAKKISKATGWRYSHLHYVLHEIKTDLLGKLPKSPITALKQSHLAYKLHEMKSDLAHTILPTRYRQVPVYGGVIYPTVLSEKSKVPASWLKSAFKLHEATDVAWELSKTVKGYGYGLTEFFSGTSFPKAVAEAGVGSLFFAKTPSFKWKERAAKKWFKPKAPEFQPFQFEQLYFTKLPAFRFERSGKLFFEKARMPTFADLLKEKKGAAVLVSPIEVAKKGLEKGYILKETMLPQLKREAPKILPFMLPSLRAFMFERAEAKEKPIPVVHVAAIQGVKAIQIQKAKQISMQALMFRSVYGKKLVSAFPKLPRRARLSPVAAEILKGKSALITGEWIYPVAEPKQALSTLIFEKVKRRRGK